MGMIGLQREGYVSLRLIFGTKQGRLKYLANQVTRSGSGGDVNLPQNLTRPDLTRRSAMASTPDCRVASASRPAPTGHSILPLSSDAPVSLAAERQPTLDPTRSHHPVTGTCPVIHEPWATHRTFEELAAHSGTSGVQAPDPKTTCSTTARRRALAGTRARTRGLS